MPRAFDRLPVRRVDRAPTVALGDHWPHTLPAVRHVLTDGLDLTPVTVLVGENGSGKSTLVEALALAFGMSPEGGSTGARHSTRATESDLFDDLRLTRGVGGARRGFFLRAETMHGFYSYLEEHPGDRPEPRFHEMSHGESFISLLQSGRFDGPGLYVFDEPESALSFSGCLALVALLKEIAARGTSQAVVATHSPLVAAVPGAVVHEVGEWGLRRSEWADLTLTRTWQAFLRDPDSVLRHL
ncbi:AAA family ATPase [Nakamurella flavida]|uniref:AAA family ATPase n=1 Tax=Nakamurella flavida TaxID=363630 RepID=A0A938YEY3_9ACTN|nr:AAA family ATPase [Nakamurella flavida]MBM9476436.1 AAA family ATPase [Nakamurella flavida]MDP9779463.1 putative ATPase [Nakamurella flavida]